MPGYRTDFPGGLIHADAVEVERQIRQGDGLGWPGDPRMDLAMGIRTAPRRMWSPELKRWVNKGEVVARRYEVYRHNEDGTYKLFHHCRLEEFESLIFQLTQRRMDSPGYVSAEDQIDKHNAELEAKASAQLRDSLGEALEHAAKLHHDRNNPRNVFRGMPGLNPEKQL